jgi:hypothetical protein
MATSRWTATAAASEAAAVESVLRSELAVVHLIAAMEEITGSQKADELVGQYLAMIIDGALDPAAEVATQESIEIETSIATVTVATVVIVDSVLHEDTMGADAAVLALANSADQ